MGAYNAAAGFGRFTAKIETYLAFFFAAILTGFGMYFIIFTPKNALPRRRTRGLVMILFAACITAFALVNLHLTKKYKIYAAATGASTAVRGASTALDFVFGRR